jgi:hypothetical protein
VSDKVQGYVHVKEYYEFAHDNRLDCWNAWLTIAFSARNRRRRAAAGLQIAAAQCLAGGLGAESAAFAVSDRNANNKRGETHAALRVPYPPAKLRNAARADWPPRRPACGPVIGASRPKSDGVIVDASLPDWSVPAPKECG